jgi:hypothetical protein
MRSPASAGLFSWAGAAWRQDQTCREQDGDRAGLKPMPPRVKSLAADTWAKRSARHGAAALIAGGALLLGGCGKQPPTVCDPPAAPTLPPAGSDGSQSPHGMDTAQLQARLSQERGRGLVEGHEAMVTCLQGERAQTDGNELRCEDWSYVRQNYLRRG